MPHLQLPVEDAVHRGGRQPDIRSEGPTQSSSHIREQPWFAVEPVEFPFVHAYILPDGAVWH
ncbi:hypothetical protein Z051_02865 [Rhodococcus rhodochrous KG-21]|uniref:Uncharacterized protein n=1 Tax=Rhodococcus rhodochrous KG-21 TaxID=1441923 RepID=A0A0M8PJR3_RHORH|nr:hypothetical protein Z051_02865 [Rhodococcus rhodochrous KG-21]